ncbi:MAG: isoaspartyl peptidase/L-asparaginase [Flavipsychrobacter sp.]
MMKQILLSICIVFLSVATEAQTQKLASATDTFVLVIHGGAGGIRRGAISKEREQVYINGLKTALAVGYNVLVRGGSAIDAVEKVIMTLENDSNFNAGKGAVVAYNGVNELDASIMDGATLNAGAVAGVTTIRNPIHAARMVMEKSPHVMLARKGAEMFAERVGCSMVAPSYFKTYSNQKMWEGNRAKERNNEKEKGKSSLKQPENVDEKYGTVGAVALDIHGNIAAGTSTGGMSMKKYARIGDSPIIGAGTYADNNSCGVSCTGWGEYYIRLALAKAVCDRVELAGMTVEQAAKEMIHDKLEKLGGDGGIIALDKHGNVSIEFNTVGMHRAYIKWNGETEVAIYKD